MFYINKILNHKIKSNNIIKFYRKSSKFNLELTDFLNSIIIGNLLGD